LCSALTQRGGRPDVARTSGQLRGDDEAEQFQVSRAGSMVTVRLRRVDLEALRSHPSGRLNTTAGEHFREHFRERISEFYRRYPYDEWCALNPQEFEAYKAKYPDTTPFSGQKKAP
jgi:hypothetical protein